jgi:hypothetical protein
VVRLYCIPHSDFNEELLFFRTIGDFEQLLNFEEICKSLGDRWYFVHTVLYESCCRSSGFYAKISIIALKIAKAAMEIYNTLGKSTM